MQFARLPTIEVMNASPTASPARDSSGKTPSSASPTMQRRPLWPYLLIVFILAAVVAGPLSGMSVGETLQLLGIPDPGPLTTFGLPVVRTIAEVCAALAIGLAFFATFYTPPQKDGTLDVVGYRSQQWAAVANAAWGIGAALLIPLTLSDQSGMPLSTALPPDRWLLAISTIDVASSWRWAAMLAIIAAIGQRLTLSWRWSVIWLVLSTAALVPVAATGHSSSAGAHDMATNSLLIHLIGASVWLGGLMAIVLHALQGSAGLGLALRRHSVIASVCLAVVAASGVINALVRVRPADVFTTTYGWLIVIKAVLIVVVGLAAVAVRNRVLGASASDGRVSRRGIWTYAGLETLIMAVTFAVAISLGRTPPPPPESIPGVQEVLLGFVLDKEPTLWSMLTQWRFDLIVGTASVACIVLYAWGLRTLHRRGDSWPISRTVFWMLGSVVLFFTVNSGMGMYMMAQFAPHMIGHMLLSMLVPVLLALGGPITLALRAIPPAGRNNPPGPREWILEFVENPISHFLTHPIVAMVQFVAGFYIVYYGGFYDSLAADHFGHLFMNIHFIISGYLFYWSIIGVDRSPHSFSPLYKLLVLLVSLPFHSFFGIMLMRSNEVLAPDWYGGLALPWVPDLLRDQQVGGGIAWGIAEIPLLLVMVALAVQWFRTDQKKARRDERKAERSDDAELAAYNAMLRGLNQHQ